MTTETDKKMPVEQAFQVGDLVRWMGEGALATETWVTGVTNVGGLNVYEISDANGPLAGGLTAVELQLVKSAKDQAADGVAVVKISFETSQALLQLSKSAGVEPDELMNAALNWMALCKNSPGDVTNDEILSATLAGSMNRTVRSFERAASALERWVDLQEAISIGENLRKQKEAERQDSLFAQFAPLVPQLIELMTGKQSTPPKPKRPKVDVDHLKPVPKDEEEKT